MKTISYDYYKNINDYLNFSKKAVKKSAKLYDDGTLRQLLKDNVEEPYKVITFDDLVLFYDHKNQIPARLQHVSDDEGKYAIIDENTEECFGIFFRTDHLDGQEGE